MVYCTVAVELISKYLGIVISCVYVSVQCWCRTQWYLHHPGYNVAAHATHKQRQCLWVCPQHAHETSLHGPDTGECVARAHTHTHVHTHTQHTHTTPNHTKYTHVCVTILPFVLPVGTIHLCTWCPGGVDHMWRHVIQCTGHALKNG